MTTTDTKRPPGLFTKAEAGSRQLVLQLGLGVTCFIVGSIFASGATTRLLDRLGPIDGDGLEWLVRLVSERTWLFVFVPLTGYAIGRFTEIQGSRFALLAVLAGETFGLLLVAGMNGFEYLVMDARIVLGRVVTLFLGMGCTLLAVNAGRRANGEAQLAANAEALARRAEYAEFLAKAEAGPSANEVKDPVEKTQKAGEQR